MNCRFNAIPTTPMMFSIKLNKKNPKIHTLTWEYKKSIKESKSYNNPKQKDYYWKYHNIRTQIILQRYGNKDSMVLAQIRHVEKITTAMWFSIRLPKILIVEKTASSKISAATHWTFSKIDSVSK